MRIWRRRNSRGTAHREALAAATRRRNGAANPCGGRPRLCPASGGRDALESFYFWRPAGIPRRSSITNYSSAWSFSFVEPGLPVPTQGALLPTPAPRPLPAVRLASGPPSARRRRTTTAAGPMASICLRPTWERPQRERSQSCPAARPGATGRVPRGNRSRISTYLQGERAGGSRYWRALSAERGGASEQGEARCTARVGAAGYSAAAGHRARL